ncbi:alpha-N-arabinofuranosidase [Chloroflexia bacterium SDU3-3]|nr:alpha-N-arabinofuranosidase [Chloroflexia bacterium SDU3-3]
MSTTTLNVRTDAPIGVISPRIYGHFAEHLGRCCYDGLWVGLGEREIAHQDGFRADVVAALKALPVPLLRWPGGCYADHYHWRDGIGPVAQRPVRLGISCGLQVADDNTLGTHEFMRLCALLGAEPYLAGNVGSGTAQELCDWLEYCNTSVPTDLGKLRVANGAEKPFGVRLWGVGNESWGCGGNYDARVYGREYLRYATMLRHVDANTELVLCGFEHEWNAAILDEVRSHIDLVDHFSIHRYWVNGGPELNFTEQDYYTLLSEAQATEDFIIDTAQLIEQATGGRHKVGIALDEWGVWHPEERAWGPGENIERRSPNTYEQANTLRDALAAAVALEAFHRQCNVLSMANLAQIVNVLHAPVMTEGGAMWLTPTYHALRMHTPHIGAQALPVEHAAGHTLPDGSPAVTATASRSADGAAITVVNRHYNQSASVRIAGLGQWQQANGELLAADDPRAQNNAQAPQAVAPAALAVQAVEPGVWQIELPAHSMATVVLR